MAYSGQQILVRTMAFTVADAVLFNVLSAILWLSFLYGGLAIVSVSVL